MTTTDTIDIGKRETVVEAVAQALIRYIAENGLKSGDRLPSERELVDMVGVSRLPLREAICILKGLGIVETKHGKGMFIKPVDVSAVFGMLSPLLRTQADMSMRHIVEVRLHLEGTTAECAARQRTDDNLRVLREQLALMRENLGDVPTFVEHDMAFHQEIARATGNPIFHLFMSSITDLMGEMQLKYPDKVEYREESIRYHEHVLEAVEARAPERARSTMQEHVAEVGKRIPG